MSVGEWIGTFGVAILLLAFALNILKRVTTTSTIYLTLNACGAILACLSSYMIKFWPFVILEAVWAIASIDAILKKQIFQKNNTLFICLAFSLMLLSGCTSLQEIQCTGVKGFKVNQVNMQLLDADLFLGVKNPNTVGFSIYRSEFDVTYSGVYFGKAKLSKRVHIRANAEEVYGFNLKGDFKGANLVDIMKIVGGAMSKGNIEVKGNLKVGKFLIRKKFPINLKEKLSFK